MEFRIIVFCNSDIVSIIMSYLTDKDCASLSLSSKDIHNCTLELGYLKTIAVHWYHDYKDILECMHTHRRTLKELVIYSWNEPKGDWFGKFSDDLKVTSKMFDTVA